MPKTETRVAAERPTPEIVAQQRAKIAGARELQQQQKQHAEQARQESFEQADQEFMKIIKEARRLRVPWRDIEAAAGLKKQTIHKWGRTD